MSRSHRWTCVSSNVPWLPRDGAPRVSFQDRLFILGGWNQYAGSRPDLAGAGAGTFASEVTSEVWCSEDDGVSWYLATTAPWSGRHMHGASCTTARSGSLVPRMGRPTTCGNRRPA